MASASILALAFFAWIFILKIISYYKASSLNYIVG
jgi:hypothetical protein